MLIAQLPPQTAEASTPVAVWIIGMFGACGGLGGLAGLIGMFATKREVDMRADAIEQRVAATEVALAAIKTELGEMERRLSKGSEDRAADTHERINRILEGLAELRGRFAQDHGK